MRVSKEERKNNARQFYQIFMNGYCNKAAIVVQRNESITNPNVNRVQFLAVLSSLSYGKPVVIAESATCWIEGCFMELLSSIKNVKQRMYFEDGFDNWLKDTYGFEIIYKDGFVFMLEKAD